MLLRPSSILHRAQPSVTLAKLPAADLAQDAAGAQKISAARIARGLPGRRGAPGADALVSGTDAARGACDPLQLPKKMKLGLVSRIAELIVKKVMGKAEQNSRKSRWGLFAPCDPITWGDARPAGLAAIDAPWGVPRRTCDLLSERQYTDRRRLRRLAFSRGEKA